MIVVRAACRVPSAVVGLFKSSKPPKTTFPTPPSGSACVGCFETNCSKVYLHNGEQRHDSGWCINCFVNFVRFRLGEAGVNGHVDACTKIDCKHKITAEDLGRNGIGSQAIASWTKFVNSADLCYLTCPSCKHGVEFAKGEKECKCDHCQPATQICTKCMQVAHAGAACAPKPKDDAEEALKRLLLMRGFRACPACQEFIEKNEGCNHMTHHKCNSHFCYDCGAQLDSDGYTDARARVNHFPNGSQSPCINTMREVVDGGYY